MPKRPVDERGGGRSAKLPTQRWCNLYLVLDDWELGYSIRKVDLLSGFDWDEADGDDTIDRTEQRLPRAVFRLEAPHGYSGQFAAFGTKIMFLGTRDNPWGTVPMYDVRTRALTSGPRRSWAPNIDFCAYLQVDGKFFLLSSRGFEMLPQAPLPPPPSDAARVNVKLDWSWRMLPLPAYRDVIAYTVHPDKQIMIFSMVKLSMKKGKRLATFSFNMDTSQWTRHGPWVLPFIGRGYFDHDLDAWVGLSCDPGTLGHLCACDILLASADKDMQPPACKISKEKLFCVDPSENHIGATLVYMGDSGRFCLVQCLCIGNQQDSGWKESLPQRLRYLLRVTTFSLKYDKHGDLRIAKHRHIGSYRLPDIAGVNREHLEKPVVFWM